MILQSLMKLKYESTQPGDWMPLWWWEKPVIQPDDGNQLLRRPTAPDPSLSWGQRLKSSNIGKQDRAEERCGGALRIKRRRRLQWRRWMEGGGQGGGSRSDRLSGWSCMVPLVVEGAEGALTEATSAEQRRNWRCPRLGKKGTLHDRNKRVK